jgi:hypothetical protein
MSHTVAKIVLALIAIGGGILAKLVPKMTKRQRSLMIGLSAILLFVACGWGIYDYRHEQPPPSAAAPVPITFPHTRVNITDSKIGRANSIADVPQGSNIEINVVRSPMENVGEVLHERTDAKEPSAK